MKQPRAATRYERIADHLTRQMRAGALLPGAKVPSVRALARRFEVSTNTVLAALASLEARGLVEARPRSGTYVSRELAAGPSLPSLPATTPAAISLAQRDPLSAFVRAMGAPAVHDFGSASPSPALLPAQRLARMVGRVARMEAHKALRYDPLPGYPLLRREIARRMTRLGCNTTPQGIVTTVGAIEALHLALVATTSPGDAVLVEAPCYFGILHLLAALGRRALEVPADATGGLDLEATRRALARRRVRAVVVVPSFSNPLGALMPAERKRELAALCAKDQIPIIESDVYGDLAFDDERPAPIKAFDEAGGVLYCSSFSKTLAPSFRVGWIAPGRYQDAVERAKFTHTVATPTVTQAAIAELLRSGGYDRHLRGLRRAMQAQVAAARAAIERAFPAGTRVSNPRGGFLLWVELPDEAVPAGELQRRALQRGISIAPGPLFSAHDRFASCMRLSCGQPWSRAQEQAIVTLGELCR